MNRYFGIGDFIAALKESIGLKGEASGHPFRGNQYGGSGASNEGESLGGATSATSDIPSTHNVKRAYQWREDAQAAIKDEFRSLAMGRAKNPDTIRVKKELIGGPYSNGAMLYKHSSGGKSIYHVDNGGDGHELYSEH